METPSAQAPLWVEYAKALGLPLLAIAISWQSTSISRWQLRIAKEKLKYDLYDRRFKVYEELKKVMMSAVDFHDYSPTKYSSEMSAIHNLINQSRFLFDDDLVIHLEKIHKDISRIKFQTKRMNLQESSDGLSPEQADREKAYFTARNELTYSVIDLHIKFLPFLRLNDLQVSADPWWRRFSALIRRAAPKRKPQKPPHDRSR